MPKATLRLATMRDLPLLVSHRRRMWEAIADFSPRSLSAADAHYRRWLRARLRNGRAAGFIIETPRGAAVASGVVWLVETRPLPDVRGTTDAYLMSMFTEPAERRRGHARRIVRAAVRWAREKGAARMTLHASQHGIRLYLKEGFHRTHEMRRSLGGRARPAARRRR